MKQALEILGDRWSVLILMSIINKPLRFSEIQANVGGINPRTLTKRLRMLEQSGLMCKKEYNEFPPRTEYEVTQKAIALKKAIEELKKWAKEHCDNSSQNPKC